VSLLFNHASDARVLTLPARMPDYVPEIAHDDSGVHSLDSLDSTHLQSASSFADTQREAEEAEEKAANHAREQAEELKKAGNDAATKAEQSARGFANKAEQTADELKKKAKVEGKQAKKEAKEAEDWADKNKGNPVVIGNVVAVAALGGLLGVGAYRKYNAHELTWKVAGAWAGAVGLFAVGDYFVSQ
jgi:cobalamin biosynthesis Mg chelatase CobN